MSIPIFNEKLQKWEHPEETIIRGCNELIEISLRQEQVIKMALDRIEANLKYFIDQQKAAEERRINGKN